VILGQPEIYILRAEFNVLVLLMAISWLPNCIFLHCLHHLCFLVLDIGDSRDADVLCSPVLYQAEPLQSSILSVWLEVYVRACMCIIHVSSPVEDL